jgi:hypothetical protein
MTVVHFPGTSLKTLTTNFENIYGFEFSAMSTPTFGEKNTFQGASLKNVIFS